MRGKYWRKEEVQFVLDNFSKMRISKIAAELDRSEDAVYQKARKLGLISEEEKSQLSWRISFPDEKIIDEDATVNFNTIEEALEYNRQVIKSRSFRNTKPKWVESRHLRDRFQ